MKLLFSLMMAHGIFGSLLAQENLVVNGSFEDIGPNYSHTFPPWRGNSSYWVNEPGRAAEGLNFAEGSYLWQDVRTVPGQTYLLTFAGPPGGRFQIHWGKVALGPLIWPNTASNGWAYGSYRLTAITNLTRLMIWTGVYQGVAFDDIRLVADGTTNLAPSVELLSPTNGFVMLESGEFKLAANASDPENDLYLVEFFAGEAKVGEARKAPFAYTSKGDLWWEGKYDVTAVAIDAQGRISVSTPTEITVVWRIKVLQQPRSQTVVAGANVVLSVAATNLLPLAYQWRVNGMDIPGATNALLILPNVSTNQSGDGYTVGVSNSVESVTGSPAAMLTVRPAAACDGESVVSLNNYDVQQPVLGTDGALASPEDTLVEVWAGPVGGALQPITSSSGLSKFKLIEPGFFDGGFGTIPGVAPGAKARIQVRAWSAGTGSGLATGESSIFIQTTGCSPALPDPPDPFLLLIPEAIRLHSIPLLASQNSPAFSGLRCIALGRRSDGQYELQIDGKAGLPVAIEASMDLLNWMQLTVITNTLGTVHFVDKDAANRERCFYRAVAAGR